MVRIQIIFLYTSSERLSEEQKNRVRSIVAEEYSAKLGISQSEIETVIQDSSSSASEDIFLAIESSKRVMNEAVLNNAVKNAVASRLSLLSFMVKTGFSGKIGIRLGAVREKSSAASSKSDKAAPDSDKDVQTTSDDYTKRAKMYVAEEPKYTFDMLKIPQKTMDSIEDALGRIIYEHEVFDQWGLYAIMPSPVSAMSFYGPPGTGKSLAAEAIASKLNKKIIRASYADIENKYVGEGPKNVSAIFLAAEQQNAVLLIDEADSLLSKRLVNVSEPSGQAMNSMRSQLLISLEKFHGIVIFATNLVVNYDKAFVSRLINIGFELPDAEMRREIWKAHLLPRQSDQYYLNIPLDKDVDIDAIAEQYEMSGRDIRNAVVEACVYARRNQLERVNHQCICYGAENVLRSQKEAVSADDHTVSGITAKKVSLTDEQKQLLADGINKMVTKKTSSEESPS